MAKTVSKVNPDLVEERQKISFEIDEFTRWFYGGQSNVEDLKFFGEFVKFKKREILELKVQLCFILILIENFFLNDPEINYDLDTSYMSHKEKYEEAIRRSTIMVKKIKQLQTEGRLGKDMFA